VFRFGSFVATCIDAFIVLRGDPFVASKITPSIETFDLFDPLP